MNKQEQVVYLVELGKWSTQGFDSIWNARKDAEDRAAQINQEAGIAGYASVAIFVLNKPNGEQ